jgi:hypothetical protein
LVTVKPTVLKSKSVPMLMLETSQKIVDPDTVYSYCMTHAKLGVDDSLIETPPFTVGRHVSV